MRIEHPAPDGKPRYVLAVEPVTRTVTVGSAEALDVLRIVGIRPRWCGPEPTSNFGCLVQVRAHGEPVPGTAYVESEQVVVDLHAPIRGVAPGQALVLYDGEQVVGSATIGG